MKRISFLRYCIIATMLFTSFTAFAGARSQKFKILVRHADKCVDLKDRKTDRGTTVHIWKCSGDIHVRANKLWMIEKMGQGYVRFVNAKKTDRCLDAKQRHKGAKVHLWSCHGGDNQQWRLDSKGGGYYRFRSKVNLNLCLDIAGASKKNGAGLTLWSCHGNHNQQFRFHVPNSHKMGKFLKEVAEEVGKQVKKVGEGFAKGMEKAGKGFVKGMKVAGSAIAEAGKAVGKAGAKAWNDFKDKVVKDKILKIAKTFADASKDAIKDLLADKAKTFGDKVANKLKEKIKKNMKKWLKTAGKKMKSELGNSAKNAAKRFGKGKWGSFKSAIKKNLKGGNIAAKVAALATEAAYMFAWSALECKIKPEDVQAAGGRFGNCFAGKAADGTFDYFYGIAVGLVMEVASKTILVPPIAVCTTIVSTVFPGLGLTLTYGCVMAVQSAANDIIDNLVKDRIKNLIWTGGPKWRSTFYKLYGGGKTPTVSSGSSGGGSNSNSQGSPAARKGPHRWSWNTPRNLQGQLQNYHYFHQQNKPLHFATNQNVIGGNKIFRLNSPGECAKYCSMGRHSSCQGWMFYNKGTCFLTKKPYFEASRPGSARFSVGIKKSYKGYSPAPKSKTERHGGKTFKIYDYGYAPGGKRSTGVSVPGNKVSVKNCAVECAKFNRYRKCDYFILSKRKGRSYGECGFYTRGSGAFKIKQGAKSSKWIKKLGVID